MLPFAMADFLSLNDFWGPKEHSPSGEWTLAHGRTDDEDEDRLYRLLRNEQVVARGKVPSRITSCSIANSGHFALELYKPDPDRTEIWFFLPDGRQYSSVYLNKFLSFFSIQDEGTEILTSYDESVVLLNVSPMSLRLSIPRPPDFLPTSGCLDGDCILLCDWTGGPYRFARDGTFLDHPRWLEAFVAKSDGERLFLKVRQMTRNTLDWTSADFLNAARWVEEALRRGIHNSFHTKVADAYSTIAWLRDKGGDTCGAEAARELAEENEDGFRVVDDIGKTIEAMTSSGDKEAIQHALVRLTRAEASERLSEYPSYYGRLFRFKGELCLALKQFDQAERSFVTALEINPKVGCKRQLDKIRRNKAK